MQYNIAQVEFFPPRPQKTETIDDFGKEMMHRVVDNAMLRKFGQDPLSASGIKIVVRFYDTTGTLTKIAKDHSRVNLSYEKLRKKIPNRSRLVKYVLSIRMGLLGSTRAVLRENLREAVVFELRKAVQLPDAVAVERPNHTFRYLREDETHDLLEMASSKKNNMWLFMYGPGTLLNEKLIMIAKVM